ncbi:flagellar basal body L-ring protein FlgH [Adhaeretor mobilis]|uniref:Flagellar L-ring protein n=1 Tax=Adhaeretor mobilis TaxID=1930276 RepID=A0A517MU61_9BACT|nr:flagellar basal body L-ring protein FlgH [Adhaeretor mobilis]QDS98317.1 Flagellar L-ring protein precursor [Adhaeretor mobilis]
MISTLKPTALALLLSLLFSNNAATAQDASLFNQGGGQQPLTVQDSSFIFKELPPSARPRELQKNDIITVIVDYNTRMLSEGDAESRKTSSLLAVLTDWIRFDGKSIQSASQASGDPSVGGTYNSQYRAESDVELRDSLTFRIAAKIVDIRPNGNLVIEAHWNIQNNEEHWRISLTGEVRRETIQADRTVTSDAIADMNIVKKEMGQVRDGYARGWFSRWYDTYKPF